jgi:hypothetical protein
MESSFLALLLVAQAALTGLETAFGAAYFRRTFGVPELPTEIGAFPAPGLPYQWPSGSRTASAR